MYTGYSDSPFQSVFGAVSLQDLVDETTVVPAFSNPVSVYDFRGLSATVATNSTYFFLEDFQDGQLDATGLVGTAFREVRTNNGRNGSTGSGFTDSVLEDQTAAFGSHGNGSVRSVNGSDDFTFSFTAADLGGNLPTYFGFVVSESTRYAKTFRAFDVNGDLITGAELLLTAAPNAGDHFMGIQTDVGIGSIYIDLNAGGEIDHIQYGTVALCAGLFIMKAGLSDWRRYHLIFN